MNFGDIEHPSAGSQVGSSQWDLSDPNVPLLPRQPSKCVDGRIAGMTRVIITGGTVFRT